MTTNGDILRDELLAILEGDRGVPPSVDAKDLYACLDDFLEELERLDTVWFGARAKYL